MKRPDESQRAPDLTPRPAGAAGRGPLATPTRSDAIETELSALEAILREEQHPPAADAEGKSDDPATDASADAPVEPPGPKPGDDDDVSSRC